MKTQCTCPSGTCQIHPLLDTEECEVIETTKAWKRAHAAHRKWVDLIDYVKSADNVDRYYKDRLPEYVRLRDLARARMDRCERFMEKRDQKDRFQRNCQKFAP